MVYSYCLSHNNLTDNHRMVIFLVQHTLSNHFRYSFNNSLVHIRDILVNHIFHMLSIDRVVPLLLKDLNMLDSHYTDKFRINKDILKLINYYKNNILLKHNIRIYIANTYFMRIRNSLTNKEDKRDHHRFRMLGRDTMEVHSFKH